MLSLFSLPFLLLSFSLPVYAAESFFEGEDESGKIVRQMSEPIKEEEEEDPLSGIFLLPSELCGLILDQLFDYKDQLSFLLCYKSAQNLTSFISRTIIHDLISDKKEKPIPHPFISLLTNLKFLYIASCSLTNVKFNTKNLKGLVIRNSNLSPDLLLTQGSLGYLDIRTNPHTQATLSFNANNFLQEVFTNNKKLVMLKLSITENEAEVSENMYKQLTQLRSLELTYPETLKPDQGAVDFIASLPSLNNIIFSSFDLGLKEVFFSNALKSLVTLNLPNLKTAQILDLNGQGFPLSRITHTVETIATCTLIK